MPLSLVDINMKRAQKRDAIHKELFWFRQCVSPCVERFTEQSLDEIMNGNGNKIGLVGLVDSYLDLSEMDNIVRLKLKKYTKIVSEKASGKLKTDAKFIREFVTNHKEYQNDSKVGMGIAYDLALEILQMNEENKYKK
jgi:glutamate--cysteine ligase catalytic subunit